MKPKITPYFEVKTCEVCGASLPRPALDLGPQPLCDDLIPIGENRESVRYPTQLTLCGHCLTAHHVFAVRKELLFPRSYHYRARLTADVLSGMEDLVRECEKVGGSLRNKLVCDIGCNDGSLLSRFRERGARTVGIEPTGAADDARQAGHHIVQSYLSPEAAGEAAAWAGQPDVVTFTNVFAHIESLSEAIDSVKRLVRPDSLLVIENHYLGSVLDGQQFDTFYHEHPRTYSVRSFEMIAFRLGGKLVHVSFPRRYGGNIRVFISNFGGPPGVRPPQFSYPADETGFAARFDAFRGFIDRWKDETGEGLRFLRTEHPRLEGKSFPGRASILINALGIDRELMPKIYEKPGSPKIGHYVPGTRIQIHSDAEWIGSPPDAMVVWAWHIADEVVRYLREKGFQGPLYVPLPKLRRVG